MCVAGIDSPTGPRFGGLPGLELCDSRELLVLRQGFRLVQARRELIGLQTAVSCLAMMCEEDEEEKEKEKTGERKCRRMGWRGKCLVPK